MQGYSIAISVAAAAVLVALGIFVVSRTADAPTEPVVPAQPEGAEIKQPSKEPDALTSQSSTMQAVIQTNKGDVSVELYGGDAPKTVENFVKLAKEDFYDGIAFHRVIPGFMIQGGDPLSKDPANRALHGTGGPGYTFEDEFNEHKVVRGALAMANAGPNTNGSQFFIVVGDAFPHLDGKHAVFGMVTAGMDIVDAIVQAPADSRDNPLEPVVIEDISIVE